MLNVKEALAPISDYLVRYEDFNLMQCLGEGGYGEVFLAEHLPTHTYCAVKRIRKGSAQEKNLLYLCREVMTLANCRNYFLLAFLGYTDTPPYLIVAEYVPRGSLYNALMHLPNAPVLTGTDKTRIAMGIACGMASLHAQDIIHRDLKSMNILLDSKLLPKICDFGVARFMGDAEGRVVSQRIGTYHWMAPELFTSQNYDNKVDVYAYGMILWEMIAEQIPFAGMNGSQIMIDVCERHMRPVIPDGTPKKLRNLIEMCWQDDPQKRPEFRQIYSAFSKGQVMFDGTDPEAVAELARQIRDTDPTAPPSTGVGLEIEAPLSSRHVESYDGDPYMMVLRNPKSDQFLETFVHVIRGLTEEKASSFFTATKEAMAVGLAPEVIEKMLSELLSLFERDANMIQRFVDTNAVICLPFSPVEIATPAFRLLLKVVKSVPRAVTPEVANKILARVDTEKNKLVSIFSELALVADKHPEMIPSMREFVKYAQNFIDSDFGAAFLRVVHHVKARVPGFSDEGVFLMGLNSANIDTIKAAYAALSPNWVQSSDVPWDPVVRHLSVAQLACGVTGILLKLQNYPPSKQLLDALVNAGAYSPHVPHILCRFCEAAENLGYMLQDFRWMTGPMTASGSFLVALRIFTRGELRPYISESPNLPGLLSRVATERNPEELMAIATMVRRMTLNPALAQKFADSQFLDRYIKITMSSQNKELINSCLIVVDAVARTAFVTPLLLLIPYLPELLRGDMALTALTTALVLSYHRQTNPTFQSIQFPQYVTQLTLPPEYERYRNDLLQNLASS